MCGIAGIVHNTDVGEKFRSRLELMRDSLLHRGPDGQSISITPQGDCGFAHTRLAILDLSEAGKQPMTSSDGRYQIVFNGEIYNFRALRAELESSGEVFNSQSDTEVLLRLYQLRGAACVEKLIGMYAFAVWDNREKTCVLARDPLGIKPLYYAIANRSLIFASELRTVLASGLVPRNINPSAVFHFFRTGSVPEPQTMIQGVSMLLAGSTLVWKEGIRSLKNWWRIQFEEPDPPSPSKKCIVESVRHALLRSVERHFVSDVPVGIFLSGGIDSTALVAMSRIAGQTDLRTFSIGFDDPALDESEIARQTAEQFKTRHVDWRLNSKAGKELFGDYLPRLDQPSVDGFNTFAVCRLAHDHGMKVVLSGLGGDELFGGYPSFRRIPQMSRVAQLLNLIPGLGRAVGGYFESRSRPKWRRFGEFISGDSTILNAYRAFRGIYTEKEADQLTIGFTGDSSARVTEQQPTVEGLAAHDQVAALELELYMRNQLLRDSDAMSMASGLELRVPFVDSALMEVLQKIPSNLRLQAGKRLLSQALPEIPEAVWNRPKRGFTFPFAQWLDEDWDDVLGATASKPSVPAQTWYQKWTKFVFIDWCRRNDVVLTADDLTGRSQTIASVP